MASISLRRGRKLWPLFRLWASSKSSPASRRWGSSPPTPRDRASCIRLGKLHTELLPHEQIGVGAQHLQRHVPIGPVQGGPPGSAGSWCSPRNSISRRIPICWRKDSPICRARLGVIPLIGGQLLRLLLHHPEGVLSELLHQAAGSGLAHPLHCAGGQVVEDLLQALGQAALHRSPP